MCLNTVWPNILKFGRSERIKGGNWREEGVDILPFFWLQSGMERNDKLSCSLTIIAREVLRVGLIINIIIYIFFWYINSRGWGDLNLGRPGWILWEVPTSWTYQSLGNTMINCLGVKYWKFIKVGIPYPRILPIWGH